MSSKRKLPTKLQQPAVKPSAKPIASEAVNDAKTVVSSGAHALLPGLDAEADVVEISSDSSNNGEEEDEEDEEDSDAEQAPPKQRRSTQAQNGDVDMQDADATADNADDAEPSFGDLMHANTADPIDVAAAFPPTPTAHPLHNRMTPPSGASLGTVLTQALSTNDVALLESCLQTPDPSTIRVTIQRLDSGLASVLLQKLAERLHRRPGRAGSLMVWVQWTLVTHGGYLATQPDLIKKLGELNKVIEVRARGLPSLLALKGKLDMLEAQMQLRRTMRLQRRELEEEEEEGVIYVEGQEEEEDSEDVSSDDHPVGAKNRLSNGAANGTRALGHDARDLSPSSSSDSMPTTIPGANGLPAMHNYDDSDDDEEEEEDSDADIELIDDEAEDTADDGDEDDVDHSDVDDMNDEDEDSDDAPAGPTSARVAVAPPPSKMAKVKGVFSRGGGGGK